MNLESFPRNPFSTNRYGTRTCIDFETEISGETKGTEGERFHAQAGVHGKEIAIDDGTTLDRNVSKETQVQRRIKTHLKSISSCKQQFDISLDRDRAKQLKITTYCNPHRIRRDSTIHQPIDLSRRGVNIEPLDRLCTIGRVNFQLKPS